MLPSFIIAGAPRSGTTSLYHYCRQHPEIFMSPVKETNFFSTNTYDFTLDAYERLFEGGAGKKAVGEASPSYLRHRQAPRAIKDLLPGCRIIITLRDPVDRLVSDFMYSRSWGHNHDLELERIAGAVRGTPSGVDLTAPFAPATMVAKGMYYDQVRRYLDVFDGEKVFLCLYDDLKAGAEALMQALYTFLGVEASWRVAVGQKHNAKSEPVLPALSRLVAQPMPIARAILGPLVPRRIRGKVRRFVLSVNRRGSPRRSGAQSLLTEEERARLVNLYREDVLRLQDLIGRDLSAWLR